jgi:lysozyme
MTILGLDISKWDGNWNAEKAKQAGANFVFIRASQATLTDSQFVSNWRKAKEAGLLRGAYHYLDYTKTANDQADYFAGLLQSDPGELPPVVDYEQVRTDNNPSIALNFLRGFLNRLSSRTELFAASKVKYPIIYTSPGFWTQYGDQTDREYWIKFPLWVAHWTTAAAPIVPAPWPMWTFWQFTSKGPGDVFGCESLSVDMNRFNGTLNDLLEFIGRRDENENSNSNPGNGTLTDRVNSLQEQFTTFSSAVIAVQANLQDRLSALEQRVQSLSPITPPAGGSTLYATCKATFLNVRSGPGTSYPPISSLRYGQRVKVLTRQNGWAQLEQPAGWASEAYLTYSTNGSGDGGAPNQDQASPPPAGTLSYGVCNTSGLNVRSGPGVTYPVVGGLTYGQRIRILEQSNGWVRIENPSGWCNASYLSIN